MSEAIDFARPIEVVRLLTGDVMSAKFLRARVVQQGRYEISWRGEEWLVAEDNMVLARIRDEGVLLPDFQVRNRTAA